MRKEIIGLFVLFLVASACFYAQQDLTPHGDPPQKEARLFPKKAASDPKPADLPGPTRVVHVFVALCDNRYQGIVPVPKQLGNGQDARSNLYWGALYGVRTFFKRSRHWKMVSLSKSQLPAVILERTVFRTTGTDPVYVVADAYDGAHMKRSLTDFFLAAAGKSRSAVVVMEGSRKVRLPVGGASTLIAFVGHNGLMDIKLPAAPKNGGEVNPRGAIVLACKSEAYFRTPLKNANCGLLLGTTGLMAPEAYTLDAVIRSWAARQKPGTLRKRAAFAYSQYQRIPLRSALKLFVVE